MAGETELLRNGTGVKRLIFMGKGDRDELRQSSTHFLYAIAELVSRREQDARTTWSVTLIFFSGVILAVESYFSSEKYCYITTSSRAKKYFN